MNELDEKYQNTLAYMYAQLPMFTRIGSAAYKPNLNNTILLCEKLGNPHLQFKSVHIAGTNGKGSTSNLMAVALQKAGYKTALYTSPHIFDFRERIKINGQDISKEFVIEFIEKNQHIINEVLPSFFELTVAMAFSYFAQEKIDIAVIEVGLGGLLDSTNIIIPEISIITNISYDHANLLGNSLQEIATQKAGIIKENIPVVIGETQEEIDKIFLTKAIQNHSPIFFADNRYECVNKEIIQNIQHLTIVDKAQMNILKIKTDLLGEYQSKNVITVLQSINVMKSLGWQMNHIDIENIFTETKLLLGFRGRFDVIEKKRKIILDASHNEAGIEALFLQIGKIKKEKLHIIIGFVKDKEVEKVLQLFPTDARYYFVEANIPRALAKDELKKMAETFSLHGNVFENISDAISEAISNSDAEDIILITGSFYILEEAYQFVEKM